MKKYDLPFMPKEFQINVQNIRQLDEFEAMLNHLEINYLKTEETIIINGWDNHLKNHQKIANKLIKTIFAHVSILQLRLSS